MSENFEISSERKEYSTAIGKETENNFIKACESVGYKCYKTDDRRDIYEHIDFIIERSNGTEFSTVAFVDGKGTTTSTSSYSYTDAVSAGKYSYRLKQIDFDGTTTYSNTVEVDLSPASYNLSQNFPNPFNPSTVIRFAMPVAGNVTLNVYNALGQKVAELVNGFKPAGEHSVDFSAANLTSGVYFYEIQAGEFKMMKKMQLIK